MQYLHSKSYLSMQYLSKYFLSIKVGEKIDTIAQLSKDLNVGRGTIQQSLKVLSDANAVVITSHGNQGSVLQEKNIKELLFYANMHFIIGVMALPYSKLYEGMSTGFVEEINKKLNIQSSLAFMSGALTRIQLVMNGMYDYTIVSKFAADHFSNTYPQEIKILHNFGKGSYVSKHVLIIRDPQYNQIEDGMRLAIDYDSIDQAMITKKASENKDVELVQMNYNQIGPGLDQNLIDAAIWNADEIEKSIKGYRIVDIDIEIMGNTEAVLVVDKSRKELTRIFEEYIDFNNIVNIQEQVINGSRLPKY